MKFHETTKTLTELKRNTGFLINLLNEAKQPVIITKNGRKVFVVLGVETYEQLKNDHALLKMVTRSETPIELERTIR